MGCCCSPLKDLPQTSNPIQVDLDSLNPKPLSKNLSHSEIFSQKESSNMIRSTIVGSRVSTSNFTFSVINQDCSPIHTLEPHTYEPQINVINKSKDEDDEDEDNNIESMQVSQNIQDINGALYRNRNERDLYRTCGKLDTIQETNSEVSCMKKDGVSIHNFNSSINPNLISILDERNFYSKAESLRRNFNNNTENISQDESVYYQNGMIKDIERLFREKNNKVHMNLTFNEIGNSNEILKGIEYQKSNTFDKNSKGNNKRKTFLKNGCDVFVKGYSK